MSRTTMKNVRFQLDLANSALRDLGYTSRELCVDSAYGGHRLNWLYLDGTHAQANICGRGTTSEIYEQLEAIVDVLFTLRRAMDAEYELQAIHDSRKSFYHKARVKVCDGVKTLYSYDTRVMRCENGQLYRKEGQPQSPTTSRHMCEFAIQCGFPAMNKAELEKLPTF